ncbi:hypothetical protein BVG19_g3776 [[Candida] boidinii]|nr:hypothetical protein BVG19_g3776 [[Candida] boidinii]OWB52612.1 hypothetical protein B5S27_g4189 [[Candida] boidinii]
MASEETNSTPKSSSSGANSTSTQNDGVTLKEKLLILANTMQFAWFIGHVLTLVFGFVYFLTYRSTNSKLNYSSYKLMYLSIIESFGIILYQSYKSKNLKIDKPLELLKNDNIQYISIAICLFAFIPIITISSFPFLLFSTFHSLTYLKSSLLPILPFNSNNICNKITNFIKKYNVISMQYSSVIELLTFIYILVSGLFWRKGYWISTIFYGLFIKLRFDTSKYTRDTLKIWEVNLDGLLSSTSIPPQIKQGWFSFKTLLKNYFSTPLVQSNAANKDE